MLKRLRSQKGPRLARSPPTKANRVQSPAGSPDLRKWESCRLVGEFSRGSLVSPTASFRHCSIFTSITLIGSQDLAAKSRSNLFTHSLELWIGFSSNIRVLYGIVGGGGLYLWHWRWGSRAHRDFLGPSVISARPAAPARRRGTGCLRGNLPRLILRRPDYANLRAPDSPTLRSPGEKHMPALTPSSLRCLRWPAPAQMLLPPQTVLPNPYLHGFVGSPPPQAVANPATSTGLYVFPKACVRTCVYVVQVCGPPFGRGKFPASSTISPGPSFSPPLDTTATPGQGTLQEVWEEVSFVAVDEPTRSS
ncbi:hypothetical protein PR048_021210 [Dryococelus australis]|uniref:Uncharacterized protein n=1 Tax=Dryococelus australis TaxID=614101 RepID=A0ABQ9GXJ5_9NEOP|nr:hypothetical protein PR048_021210 [Dryococelus australis]